MTLRLVWCARATDRETREIADYLLQGDGKQVTACHRLYDILVKTKGSPPCHFLRRALHKLFESLLCPTALRDGHLVCPTEVYLFLASLSENGYCSARYIRKQCCKIQFCFRIIYIHIARLEAEQLGEYEPFSEKDSHGRQGQHISVSEISHSCAEEIPFGLEGAIEEDVEPDIEDGHDAESLNPDQWDEIYDAVLEGWSKRCRIQVTWLRCQTKQLLS